MAKQSIYQANRAARRRVAGETAKEYFKTALKKDSIESRQARAGRKFVVGVTSSLHGASGGGSGKEKGKKGESKGSSGAKGPGKIFRLPPTSTGWSNLGLIAGSPFKDYRSREVFPSSRADRSLHPQEKAEIDALIQKVRLFGASPSQLSTDNKKKPEAI